MDLDPATYPARPLLATCTFSPLNAEARPMQVHRCVPCAVDRGYRRDNLPLGPEPQVNVLPPRVRVDADPYERGRQGAGASFVHQSIWGLCFYLVS